MPEIIFKTGTGTFSGDISANDASFNNVEIKTDLNDNDTLIKYVSGNSYIWSDNNVEEVARNDASFNVVVWRRVSQGGHDNYLISSEFQLFIGGQNILPSGYELYNSNGFNNRSTAFYRWNTKVLHNITNYETSLFNSSFSDAGHSLNAQSDNSLIIFLKSSYNIKDIQSIVVYGQLENGSVSTQSVRAKGTILELYNDTNDVNLNNPLISTHKIDDGFLYHAYRWDFPAIIDYNNFTTSLSTTQIYNGNVFKFATNYIDSNLFFELPNYNGVITSIDNVHILPNPDNTQTFNVVVWRRVSQGGHDNHLVNNEFQLFIGGQNILPSGYEVYNSGNFNNRATTHYRWNTKTANRSNAEPETILFNENFSGWGHSGSANLDNSLIIFLKSSYNIKDIQSIVVYGQLSGTNVHAHSTRAKGTILELYNDTNDVNLINPLLSTHKIDDTHLYHAYRWDFPAIINYNNFTTSLSTTQIYNGNVYKFATNHKEVLLNEYNIKAPVPTQTFNVVVWRRVSISLPSTGGRDNHLISSEFQLFIGNVNILPSGYEVYNSGDFNNRETTFYRWNTKAIHRGPPETNLFNSNIDNAWGYSLNQKADNSLIIFLKSSYNIKDIQSIVVYGQLNANGSVNGDSTRAMGTILELYNDTNDVNLNNPLLSTHKIDDANLYHAYRWDFPAIINYNNFSTSPSNAQICDNNVYKFTTNYSNYLFDIKYLYSPITPTYINNIQSIITDNNLVIYSDDTSFDYYSNKEGIKRFDFANIGSYTKDFSNNDLTNYIPKGETTIAESPKVTTLYNNGLMGVTTFKDNVNINGDLHINGSIGGNLKVNKIIPYINDSEFDVIVFRRDADSSYSDGRWYLKQIQLWINNSNILPENVKLNTNMYSTDYVNQFTTSVMWGDKSYIDPVISTYIVHNLFDNNFNTVSEPLGVPYRPALIIFLKKKFNIKEIQSIVAYGSLNNNDSEKRQNHFFFEFYNTINDPYLNTPLFRTKPVPNRTTDFGYIYRWDFPEIINYTLGFSYVNSVSQIREDTYLKPIKIDSLNVEGNSVVNGDIQGINLLIGPMKDMYAANRIIWKIGDYSDENLGFFQDYTIRGYIEDGATNVRMNFTGQHRTFVDNIPYKKAETNIGLIVCSNKNTYINMSNGIKKGNKAITINESLPVVSLSTKINDKSCFGVISSSEDPENRVEKYGCFCTPFEKEEGDIRIFINSVGEGAIWVTNKNGNLEAGDYITTSDIPGYGMKQEDDFLHNYTVAKITMDCNFNPEYIKKETILKDVSGINILDENGQIQFTNEEITNEEIIGISNEEITNEEIIGISNEEITNEEIIGISNEEITNEEIIGISNEEITNEEIYEYAYEIRYLDISGNIITKEEYDIIEEKYIAAFVGCTYHCG